MIWVSGRETPMGITAAGWAWTMLGSRTRSGSKPRIREMLNAKRGDREASHLPKRSEGVHALLGAFIMPASV